MGSTSISCDCSHHVILFPFMSKGHTIPLLHLAHLLLRLPRVAVTVFTTPANRPFISNFLVNTTASIVNLTFPENVPGIPPGIESTDKLPSISLYVPLARATKLMQTDFERAVQDMPRVSFLVSDGFLWWTLESATKFGFPRFVFYGMNNYSSCVSRSVGVNRTLLAGPKSDDELITVTGFPWIKVTRNDFDPVFTDAEPKGPPFELFIDQVTAASNSYGMIVNSFYELEPVFVEHLNREAKPKAYSVLYVAFGTQADISPEQLKEISSGLEESNVNFLWVIRNKESELGDGFEERVKDRGIIVREWVEQREILLHQSIQGFLSHCGWNSVMESICAGVPILAWPMMADQPLNARMVVEEIKVGVRVETCNGSVKGFVKKEGLEKMVKELMEGDKGEEVRKKVKEYAEMANKAMEENTGSSWRSLDMLMSEISNFTPQEKMNI
ncbi:hypothetical protein EZV62_019893 [Acer yangbiense]|uniref:Glycosyltransferase n=1 Tax=Acer yangbiense TaxID=1000413 RepID=A0A5C7HCL4_9ROSI|nr:hypothetical protein EZV62_019893 [Acer yangbiense]